jgi:hypothetical protein
MIPDLARPAGFHEPPARRQIRQLAARRMLDIYTRARGKPAVLFEQGRRPGQKIRGKRRIEENHVDGLGYTREVAKRIRTLHARALCGPLDQPGLQLAHRSDIPLDEHHTRCAAREGFQAERAAAAEQIQTSRPGDMRTQPVSRTRSGVGRISASAGNLKRRPRQEPPMILSSRDRAPRCGAERDFPVRINLKAAPPLATFPEVSVP